MGGAKQERRTAYNRPCQNCQQLQQKIKEQEKSYNYELKCSRERKDEYMNKLGEVQRENANLKSKIRELEPEKEHKEITTILGKEVEITYLPHRQIQEELKQEIGKLNGKLEEEKKRNLEFEEYVNC